MGSGGRRWVRGRCVGRGSTASVYLAAGGGGQGGSESLFAVKSAELPAAGPLRREQKILSSLCSPHVVSCLGSDVAAEPDGRVLYNLFMEYVPGGSLAEAVKRQGGFHERAIGLYARGILRGLAYLHGRGVVHCDVKGHNVLLGRDGLTVKLADFGCARWANADGDRGIIGGTPLYMAPEVARGEEQGPAADIWALGCTVIEMATGCPPWRDIADPVAAIHRIAFSDVVPEFPCTVSDGARDFLGRCLSRDPSRRWSAEELLSHPFVNCVEEFAAGDVAESKGNSPKSILDQDFWDSLSEEEDEDGSRATTNNIVYPLAPTASAQERLRPLVGARQSPPPPPPSANPTWEDSRWITIRNGGPPEDRQPSISGSLCFEETVGDLLTDDDFGDGSVTPPPSLSSSSSSHLPSRNVGGNLHVNVLDCVDHFIKYTSDYEYFRSVGRCRKKISRPRWSLIKIIPITFLFLITTNLYAIFFKKK